jgi:hypothetical protein
MADVTMFPVDSWRQEEPLDAILVIGEVLAPDPSRLYFVSAGSPDRQSPT